MEWFEGPFSGKIEKNVRELYWSLDIHFTNQKSPRGPPIFLSPHTHGPLSFVSSQTDTKSKLSHHMHGPTYFFLS